MPLPSLPGALPCLCLGPAPFHHVGGVDAPPCACPQPAASSAALGYLDVRVVDTDYSSFAVVYIYKELEGALSTMVQLYSEGSPVPPPDPTHCPAWTPPHPLGHLLRPCPPHHTLPSLDQVRVGADGTPSAADGYG